MAQRNLRAAADAVERHRPARRELGVDEEEAAAGVTPPRRCVIPYDEALGVHPQAEAFTEHAPWDFEATAPDQYPLLLHFPYFDLYRKQVVKQADLVLAMHLRGDAFTAEQKARDFDYYERLTVRDSSLSACTQAVIAAEVGHLELAYDYLSRGRADRSRRPRAQHARRAAHRLARRHLDRARRRPRRHARRDLPLSFAPRLPAQLTRLIFNVCFRDRHLRVEVTHERATYSLRAGGELDIVHHGKPVKLEPRRRVTLAIPPARRREAPSQPRGRAPERRRPVPEQRRHR